MLYNLSQIFTQGMLPSLKEDLPPLDSKTKPDDFIAQASFDFSGLSPVKVTFVTDADSFTPIEKYGQLPPVPLTQAEQKILGEATEEFKRNPKFYNGNHVLFTQYLYDDERNEVFVVAYRADYALLQAIQSKIFPRGSPVYDIPLFRSGAIVPIVTDDKFTVLLQRADFWKLWSAPSGFLECKDSDASLTDLVPRTAVKEAYEEVLNDKEEKPRMDHLSPFPTSLSFRVAYGASDILLTIHDEKKKITSTWLNTISDKNKGIPLIILKNSKKETFTLWEKLPTGDWLASELSPTLFKMLNFPVTGETAFKKTDPKNPLTNAMYREINSKKLDKSPDTTILAGEWIVPLRVKNRVGHSAQKVASSVANILHILTANTAKDSKEHIAGQVIPIPLDPRQRGKAVEFLKEQNQGSFLYAPILATLTGGDSAAIPYTHTRNVPVTFLTRYHNPLFHRMNSPASELPQLLAADDSEQKESKAVAVKRRKKK